MAKRFRRWSRLVVLPLFAARISTLLMAALLMAAPVMAAPNILICVADDWGWPHAGVYGDRVIETPTFDRLCREGVRFNHAFVSSPSCTPSRNAILTGQHFWRLGAGANLWSTLSVEIPVYPVILRKAGYHVGRWRKCWGPGDPYPGGYTKSNPCGNTYRGFDRFLKSRPAGAPFCFWLGSSDPHRPYETGSGREAGLDVEAIELPAFYPDSDVIRADIADYYWEVQRFDRECGQALKLLEEAGELDNTIVVMTSDHGMPFPRCKANLYDWGVRVPLAIRWGKQAAGGRTVDEFVSLTDLAPTFLEASGLAAPAEMTGRSFLGLLSPGRDRQSGPPRTQVVFGRERHTPAQASPSLDAYPARAIRTERWLYINNLEPSRWPAGVPSNATFDGGSYTDCDDGPTKEYLVTRRDDPEVHESYELCFGLRPAEELYDVVVDPDQINNLAGDPAYEAARKDLAARLEAIREAAGDPRLVEGPAGGSAFDRYRYPYRRQDRLKSR
ncbi:MAG: sulfatase [Planctomycetota bacterium]